MVWQTDRHVRAHRLMQTWRRPGDGFTTRLSGAVLYSIAVAAAGQLNSTRKPGWIQDGARDIQVPAFETALTPGRG
jgi:hypothetical protein